MSVSGSRASDEINLEEFERRLRAAGAQQARAEDPLAELSRLVEFSHFGISNGGTSARRGAEPAVAPRGAFEPRSKTRRFGRRSTTRWKRSLPAPRRPIARRGKTTSFTAIVPTTPSAAEPAEERRPTRWKLAVSGLALAGVAMIGAVFALKGGVPGLPKQPPFIAAAQGPTKVAPPSDETVAASNDPGASLLKDNAKPVTRQSRQFRGAAGRFERTGVAQQSAFRRRQSARGGGSGQAAGGIGSDGGSPPPSIRRLSRRPARRRPS